MGEGNVWLEYVRDVIAALNQFISMIGQRNQGASISSPNVPTSVVVSSSTPKTGQEKQSLLLIKRDLIQKGNNEVYGEMFLNEKKMGETLENGAHLIQAGTYNARLDMSPHLGYRCPHLQVPERDKLAGGDAGLRVHVSNWISQLAGCIAIGQRRAPSCIEGSQAAFDALMLALPDSFVVTIE